MTGPVLSDGQATRVSVVICVYTERRWLDMLAAIDSVRHQSLPAHELIVVVDHNQALHDRLATEFAADQGHPAITIVPNRQQRGLSGGKNTGVLVATGDVVAFLDDDAVAQDEWLKYLADCYCAPQVAGVGGLTLPNWDHQRPAWFPREFDWVLGCNYLGMPPPRQPVRNLLGGNASFRRAVFGQVGGFASAVGRSAAKLPLGCEETEFCIRIGQQLPGAQLLIDDRAVIWHRVPRQRATVSYFLTRCYAEGVSKSLVSERVGATDGLSAERRQAFAALPRGVIRNLASACRGDLAGLGRAAAISAGLSAAAGGYVVGRLARR